MSMSIVPDAVVVYTSSLIFECICTMARLITLINLIDKFIKKA